MPAVGAAGTVEEPDPLRDDGFQFPVIIAVISSDRVGKVDSRRGGKGRMGTADKCCRHSPTDIVFLKLADLLYDFMDVATGGLLGFFGIWSLSSISVQAIQIRLQSLQ